MPDDPHSDNTWPAVPPAPTTSSPPTSKAQRVVFAAAATASILIVAVMAWLFSAPNHKSDPGVTALADVSGLGGSRPPPWPLPAEPQIRARAAGLAMGAMRMAKHYHVELTISVDAKRLPVPAGLGVDPTTGAMSAVHTHPDRLIHVEAGRGAEEFTLGQLFTQWNVALNAGQIGGLRARDGARLMVRVNRRPWAGNPALIPLAEDQQIGITYTSAKKGAGRSAP